MVDTTDTTLETAPETPYVDEEEIVIEDDTIEIEEDDTTEADLKEAKPEEEFIQVSKKEFETIKESSKQSTQEAQKLLWVDRVRTDNENFIKLYESDKVLAEKVLKHVGEERDARTLYNELRKAKYGEDDRVVQREELLQAIEEKEIKKEFNRMIKANGLDLDSKTGKVFKEEYDFLTDNGRRLTSENVDSFITKAMKLSGVKDISKAKEKTDKELIGAGTVGRVTNTTTDKQKGNYFDQFEKGGPSKRY